VLGAHDATQRIPEGSMVSVVGVSVKKKRMPTDLNSLTMMRMT